MIVDDIKDSKTSPTWMHLDFCFFSYSSFFFLRIACKSQLCSGIISSIVEEFKYKVSLMYEGNLVLVGTAVPQCCHTGAALCCWRNRLIMRYCGVGMGGCVSKSEVGGRTALPVLPLATLIKTGCHWSSCTCDDYIENISAHVCRNGGYFWAGCRHLRGLTAGLLMYVKSEEQYTGILPVAVMDLWWHKAEKKKIHH